VTEIAAQWPLVALVVVIMLAAGRVIQQQYESRIAQYREQLGELREDVTFWRDIALAGTSIAGAVTSALEHTAKRRP
jgi:Tfp pilus assembly protein PilO